MYLLEAPQEHVPEFSVREESQSKHVGTPAEFELQEMQPSIVPSSFHQDRIVACIGLVSLVVEYEGMVSVTLLEVVVQVLLTVTVIV